MGDSFLVRRVSSKNEDMLYLKTEVFKENTIWTPPKGMKDNTVSVVIFGGGGGGLKYINTTNSYYYAYCGGGGGFMNKANINIPYGEQVQIIIGNGGLSNLNGSSAMNGGTTYFGNYLSANGGEGASYKSDGAHGGSGGSGGSVDASGEPAHGGKGYQFGGGGAFSGGMSYNASGGDGGIWGGGGSASSDGKVYGGNGGTYGGGGGAVGLSRGIPYGGNGGTYGGGGGAVGSAYTPMNIIGIGGDYGGNGGNYTKSAQRGTDTSSWTNVDLIPASADAYLSSTEVNMIYLRGEGLSGGYITSKFGKGSGGGGYGGNGGYCGGGGYGGDGGKGGGGYGGNGGGILQKDYNYVSPNDPYYNYYVNHVQGGGGGYGPGADGASNIHGFMPKPNRIEDIVFLAGGGGFYTASTGSNGAGIGVYGAGGYVYNRNSIHADGTSGVCIIQYWAP